VRLSGLCSMPSEGEARKAGHQQHMGFGLQRVQMDWLFRGTAHRLVAEHSI
jgi:hypothetical protein